MKTAVAVLFAVLSAGAALSQDSEKPFLAILTDTGQVRDGLPVLAPHPDEARIVRELSKGFVLTMTRLYRDVQIYLEPGTVPEPAYLLFSRNQGGFPRFGFYLNDTPKSNVGYVDLYATKSFSGQFAAADQIFPHELGHVIMRRLAGEPGPGGSNQMHAIAVRTDPRLAYQEGFAEHLQVMAVDDPQADPATRALSSDVEQLRLAERNLRFYRRELEARWSFATPKRLGFLLWFGGTEQVLRYHAVKANGFAYAPDIPDRLLAGGDPYLAYLSASVVPGAAGHKAKPAGVMLSTEGVVATLFYRWVTRAAIATRYLDEDFYGHFGTSRQSLSPTENAYLKLFHAIRTHRPQTVVEAVQAYKAVYPEESADVDAIVSATLLGQQLPQAPAIWLANRRFSTGSSLYDQYRSIPRVHTFDLNAATEVDLVGVPGVDRTTADVILRSGPYSSVADLKRVGVNPALQDQFRKMESDMRRVGDDAEEGVMSSLPHMIWAYVWRALVALAVSAAAGAVLFRRVRRKGWFRSAASALAVSFLVLALSWAVMGGEGVLGYALGVSVFAVPSSLYLAARRRWAQVLPAILAWALAALPARVLTWPLF